MVRYIMSFHIPESQLQTATKIINSYFDALQKSGPAGMRSQCYEANSANNHFKSAIFKEYLQKLTAISGKDVYFSKLYQQQTFESIY